MAADEAAPTNDLVTGVVGEGCPNCQSPMAADQRYCLSCGERRGRARFSPEALATQTVATSAAAPALPPRSRLSAGPTLVAGVATLLLAMGVGVLIGHSSNTSTAVRTPAAAQVITVGGGSGAAAGTTAAQAMPAAVTSADKKRKVAKPTVVHVTAQTARKATAAASKVLGSSKNLTNNVQQSVGGSCSGGAGCQNGKFTGNFFPGG